MTPDCDVGGHFRYAPLRTRHVSFERSKILSLMQKNLQSGVSLTINSVFPANYSVVYKAYEVFSVIRDDRSPVSGILPWSRIILKTLPGYGREN